jgi:hypothetical protein
METQDRKSLEQHIRMDSICPFEPSEPFNVRDLEEQSRVYRKKAVENLINIFLYLKHKRAIDSIKVSSKKRGTLRDPKVMSKLQEHKYSLEKCQKNSYFDRSFLNVLSKLKNPGKLLGYSNLLNIKSSIDEGLVEDLSFHAEESLFSAFIKFFDSDSNPERNDPKLRRQFSKFKDKFISSGLFNKLRSKKQKLRRKIEFNTDCTREFFYGPKDCLSYKGKFEQQGINFLMNSTSANLTFNTFVVPGSRFRRTTCKAPLLGVDIGRSRNLYVDGIVGDDLLVDDKSWTVDLFAALHEIGRKYGYHGIFFNLNPMGAPWDDRGRFNHQWMEFLASSFKLKEGDDYTYETTTLDDGTESHYLLQLNKGKLKSKDNPIIIKKMKPAKGTSNCEYYLEGAHPAYQKVMRSGISFDRNEIFTPYFARGRQSFHSLGIWYMCNQGELWTPTREKEFRKPIEKVEVIPKVEVKPKVDYKPDKLESKPKKRSIVDEAYKSEFGHLDEDSQPWGVGALI